MSKGDRPDRVPHPWPASPGCMCRAPARPTPRSRDGGKTPSSRPLDGVHNFPPELNRPGEPGLTFQASEDTAQPPRYSPQRDQPHGSGSPDLCHPGLHPHHTPHARPPHHSSVRPAGCHALVEPLLHLGRVGQCGWGCGSERLSAPSPSSHPLPEAFPGPCDLAAAAAAPCLGGWADVSASSGSFNLPTPHLCAGAPFAGFVLVLQSEGSQVRRARSGSVPTCMG